MSTVATGPFPLSNDDSITTPVAGPLSSALSSRISACRTTESSSASTPGSIISVSNASNATSALTTVDTAIDTIANTRAKFGASENAIDSRLNYLLDAKTNSISRLSKIEDADFALETAKLSKAQIMSKAASSMLAQANAGSEVLLRLLN